MSQKINIATGMSAKSKVWKNSTIDYADFVNKIKEAHHTTETYKEFMAANKEEQSKIKDVGGYVGGYLRAGKRSPENVVHRQIMTLDIDFAHLDFWDDFTMQFDNAAMIHGTHKHSDLTPRYRLILPLDREATPDEYVAVSRKIAGDLGIDLFDNTTFETNRLMFWPSSPKDVDYYFEEQDGPWLSVDEILASYIDWKDTSLWPTADKKIRELGEAANKQQDPELKKGIVGAFCRSYTITEAIDKFLQEQYIPTADDKRYTYTSGSTAAGLMVYDDKFAYSHHGTDPCSGKLSNVFDLVRLHLFGHLDGESYAAQKPKSFFAMEDFARADELVKKTIAVESLAAANYDFNEDLEDAENVEGDQESIDWMLGLEADSKGRYLSSASNINTILSNDARLKEAFKQNSFDGKRYVFKSLPWRKITSPEPIKDVDYSGIRNYIESIYGISGTLKIDDSIALELEKQAFHPIKDYLKSLEWDGVPRVDTLLIDYFGAEDNLYTREAIRKTLAGAVARVFNPGCKFDMVLVLVSAQGAFKSTFIKTLGKEWYSDSFSSVHGTQAFEQIQGVWIMELAELAGLRKADVEAVKHFLTKQEDSFRPAYGRVTQINKRQCVFFATTNKKDFLNDSSGNRRFNPVDARPEKITKHVVNDLPQEVDQIWAEAMQLYKKHETLYLSPEAEKIAKNEQHKHSETDERTGMVEHYLEAKLPDNWASLDIFERRIVLDSEPKDGTIKEVVCMAEIWCECLGKKKEDMDRYNTRAINEILKSLSGWEYHTSTKNFKLYGKQKYYSRKSL
jgi:putative DNA primase/helicase